MAITFTSKYGQPFLVGLELLLPSMYNTAIYTSYCRTFAENCAWLGDGRFDAGLNYHILTIIRSD